MKKAQIQSGETIIVLIIVMILLILGLVFYSSFQGSSRQDERVREAQINAMGTALRTANMDELKCSNTVARIERCIDYFKLNVTPEIIQENYEKYFSFFGNTNITLHIVSNPGDETINEQIHIFSYTGNFSRQSIPTFLPVIIRDPIKRINYFGYLEVRVLTWKKLK